MMIVATSVNRIAAILVALSLARPVRRMMTSQATAPSLNKTSFNQMLNKIITEIELIVK